MDRNSLLFRYNIATHSISILPLTLRRIIMKKALIILFAVLLLADCPYGYAESEMPPEMWKNHKLLSPSPDMSFVD